MTKEEQDVMTWACNLTDSIIAGVSDMPKEMIWCINNLQDAVYDYLGKNKLKLKNMISKDYVEFRDKQYAERERQIKEMCARC